MPFQSEAQRGFMYAKHPKIAKRFEEETPKDAKLPEHVKKMNQGGMAGDWKSDLANYMDQHFNKRAEPQHMADGGLAGDFGVDLGDTSTVRGLPLSQTPPPMPGNLDMTLNPKDLFSAPPPFMPQTAAAPAPKPVFNPNVGLKTDTVSTADVMPTGPDPALQGYLQQRKDSLNKYGPDEQMALEQSLLKQRRGLIPNLALAGTGLADAIMQGVARAGSSNFQSNLENRMDKTEEGQRQAFEKAQTGNLSKMKQEMELDNLDPASVLSKSTQRANMPTLRRLGYSAGEIAQIPASLMPDATSRRLTLEEINQKGELAKATLGMTGAELGLKREVAGATAANQQTERAEADRKLHAEHPVLSAFGMLGKSAGAAGAPAAVGPLGQTTMKDGVQWTWSPVSGQYHRSLGPK